MTVTVGNGVQVNIEVPSGYLHASEVIDRTPDTAWTALHAHAERLEGTLPSGVSPKMFPAEVVAQIEAKFADAYSEHAATLAAEKTARDALEAAEAARLAAQVPRLPEGSYNSSNTLGRGLLKSRGWTDGHITRLLGGPDCTIPSGYERQHLWGAERVAYAEANDTKLMKRLATYRAKRADEKTERIAASIDTGKVIFRKDGDTWVLVGRGLVAGATVEVTKRDGTTTTKRVERVLSTDAAGVSKAVPVDEVAEARAAARLADAEARAAERAAAQETRQRAAAEARPTGSPALPAGTRRNQRSSPCHGCHSTVHPDKGALRQVWAGDDEDDEAVRWEVWCSPCTWRTLYRLPVNTDTAPWVALNWPAADVQLVVAAGLNPTEAAAFDLSDPATREWVEMIRALRA
ncbi:hypothetical protein [uncultured Nocardioides sp.]|uniref:hypothetical protein n=1 Tax=uncultured Nocardioides sp. TaxID=198441 RepID=UPI0030F517C9